RWEQRMAVTPYEVYEGFTRSRGSGWGDSDSGATWTYHGSGAVLSVSNGIGQMQIPWNSSGAHIVALSQRPRQKEREVLARFSVSSTADISFGIAINHNTTNNTHYRIHSYGNDLRLISYTNGNSMSIANVSIPLLQVNQD